jgi:hypothetical protein
MEGQGQERRMKGKGQERQKEHIGKALFQRQGNGMVKKFLEDKWNVMVMKN